MKRAMSCLVSLVCTAFVLLAALSSNPLAQEVIKDGVPHTISPAKPTQGSSTITPHEMWQAGGMSRTLPWLAETQPLTT